MGMLCTGKADSGAASGPVVIRRPTRGEGGIAWSVGGPPVGRDEFGSRRLHVYRPGAAGDREGAAGRCNSLSTRRQPQMSSTHRGGLLLELEALVVIEDREGNRVLLPLERDPDLC